MNYLLLTLVTISVILIIVKIAHWENRDTMVKRINDMKIILIMLTFSIQILAIVIAFKF